MTDGNTTLVIFGATGDLTQRKLVPAILNLRRRGLLKEGVRIVGFARSQYTDAEFCERMWKGVRELGGLEVDRQEWDDFAQDVCYVEGDLGNLQDYQRLQQKLEELEGDERPANRLFYLSVAPNLYEPAIKNLGTSGLTAEDTGWRRVVVEKPFGRDLASAQALNQEIHRYFAEEQVLRIDHYLGKETVQNLMVFRFANAIFEPLWNRNYVDQVQITVAETVSVGDRAGYYDGSGVVRDMLQNHLLQLLTMVAMEPPTIADAESLRNKKVEVLKAIRRWKPQASAQNAVRGQYQGYLDETGVAPDSTTATYAAVRLYVDNWRWTGVPFYLRTGKSMAEKTSEIVIQFKSLPHVMFTQEEAQSITPNVLSICLQPDEGIHLKFQVKVPGQDMTLRSMDLEFHYDDSFKSTALPDAYERLLQDALEGDTSLFIRSDHIEEAWQIVEPLLEWWEGGDPQPPHTYQPGTWGPKETDDLPAQDGRTWLQVCGTHEQPDA